MKTFITGGIKSGKSNYALERARKKKGAKGFIATALVKDNDMANKIKEHKLQRGTDFETIEEPYELTRAVRFADRRYAITVIDCLNMWLLNLMEERHDIEKEKGDLIHELKNSGSSFVIVSNEVSSGIIPADETSRRFVEELSRLNANVAKVCNEVILMVAGYPLIVKGEKL